jgi:hypothetical protein
MLLLYNSDHPISWSADWQKWAKKMARETTRSKSFRLLSFMGLFKKMNIVPHRLHSVFLLAPFPPSFSHFATFISHVLDCISFLIVHSAPPFLSFHPISVFSLLDTLSPGTPEFPLSYTSHAPCCTLIL